MILLDTSGLLAAIDGSEEHHAAARRSILATEPPRLLSPFVLAELDYLLGQRVGAHAQEALLEEVERGTYELVPMTADDVGRARAVIARYPALRLGIADASIVVLAERHACADVLTLDERHFRALRWSGGRQFVVLPADAAVR